jgi:hypothetical protein
LKYADQKLEILTSLHDPNHDSKYTVGAMHPDGLIYTAGTEGGKLIVWDLKTQKLAMALTVSYTLLLFLSIVYIDLFGIEPINSVPIPRSRKETPSRT